MWAGGTETLARKQTERWADFCSHKESEDGALHQWKAVGDQRNQQSFWWKFEDAGSHGLVFFQVNSSNQALTWLPYPYHDARCHDPGKDGAGFCPLSWPLSMELRWVALVLESLQGSRAILLNEKVRVRVKIGRPRGEFRAEMGRTWASTGCLD